MPRRLSALFVLLVSATFSACSKSDSPTGPTTLSGKYQGPASDVTGSGVLTLNVSQSGSTVSGTAITSATAGSPGTSGTVSGTLSGSTLTFTITFTTSNPPCTITISGTATGVTSSTIAGTYSATSTCGNPVSGGTFSLTKQ
jgi:hypothetical protein